MTPTLAVPVPNADALMALRRLVRQAEGHGPVAAALNVDRSQVTRWLSRGRIPVQRRPFILKLLTSATKRAEKVRV